LSAPAAADPPARAPDPRGLARRDVACLAVLCAALLAVWAAQFRFFFLPNNDYTTFEVVAKSFGRLELPGNFQRLPLLPAVMAVLAPLLPARHPELDAALAVNLLCALATLPLLALFAARAFGRGALLVPVLFAGTTQIHAAALQPLVEPSLGLFVVLAFVLFQARSPWQYAAAGAAALSRYEAAALLALFAAANALEDRRFFRHAALAAAAGLPFVAWLAAGALAGSGAAFYAADMERMGWTPAPHVVATLLKEAYRGWWSDAPGPDLPLFLLAAALPTLAGVAVGWRRFRRETVALLVYLALTVLVIVGLGIDKARYLYPVLWIPQLFFAAGLLAGADALVARAERVPAWALGALAASGAGAAVLLARHWVRKLLATPPETGAWPDLVLLPLLAALALGALGGGLALRPARARLAASAAVALAFAAAMPFVAGGLEGRQKEWFKIRFANYGVVLSARWLEEHLAPGERFVAANRQHYLFLSGFDASRIATFYELDAKDPAELAAELRARGVTYLVATWRKPVAQSIDAVYERKYKWFLVDPFTEGAPVAGFEHVAAIELPAFLEQPPLQIYRVTAPR
jgi:hypothetical protein